MEPNHNYKTRRCRHFDMGRCRLGGMCNFAHGNEELNRYRNEFASAAQPGDIAEVVFAGNSQKILALEKSLEEFTATQKALLQHLRQLTQSLEGPATPAAEANTNSIDDCLQRLHQTSLKYADTLAKLALNKREPSSSFDPEEKLKRQIEFLAARLKQLHKENKSCCEIIAKAEELIPLNVAEAAVQLEKVIYSSSVDRITQAAHKNLIEEARRKAF